MLPLRNLHYIEYDDPDELRCPPLLIIDEMGRGLAEGESYPFPIQALTIIIYIYNVE